MMSLNIDFIANQLGKATRTRGGWSCLCPAHDDHNPSLALSLSEEGVLLAHCYAGCSFPDIMFALRSRRLSEKSDFLQRRDILPQASQSPKDPNKMALRIWFESVRAEGTYVETYLRSRGIQGAIPPTLRFHPRLFHNSKTYHPAMVAAVTLWPSKTVAGVHRTYLTGDGTDKAILSPNSMSVINVKERINRAEPYIALQTEQTRPRLRSLNVRELLELEIPPREMILNPILPEQGLVMLYAPRGIGKTHVALWMAYTIACGDTMFGNKWQCEKPRKVLFVDGEMPASTLQMRLSSIVASSEKELEDVDNLKIITPDYQELGIPDLSTLSGQEWLEPHLEKTNLLILDNLSSLCRSGRENESESWNPLQGWLLKLRRKGISVLFVHHAGKGGNQRGTSKKEDILDTVIVLRKPNDYDQREGARFEVHYEKARGFYGEEARPFEAWLKEEDGKITWQVHEIEDLQLNRLIDLHKDGLKQREIAQELGLGLGTVNRWVKKAKEEGKVE